MADELIENKREIDSVMGEVNRLAAMVDEDKQLVKQSRMLDIENAMAVTLEEIAQRIEKIAAQIDTRERV